MSEKNPGLRERTRCAVRKEITDAANALFAERGYADTTVDIAAAVGVSQRSVFRYFPTKEDIVVGKFDPVADEMLQVLRERPVGQPVWESVRRVFDLLVPHVDAPGRHAVAEPMQRIVFSTLALPASHLQKLQQRQESVVAALCERADGAGRPYADDDPAPRALEAAAFGWRVAAQHSWVAAGAKGTFASSIDRAMATMGPRI
jgi:AcrR family transcriptional regulator